MHGLPVGGEGGLESTVRIPNWLNCVVVNCPCCRSLVSVAGNQVQASVPELRVAAIRVVPAGTAWSSAIVTVAVASSGPAGPSV